MRDKQADGSLGAMMSSCHLCSLHPTPLSPCALPPTHPPTPPPPAEYFEEGNKVYLIMEMLQGGCNKAG